MFSSWPYASVCSSEIKWFGNLTDGLTGRLPARLTEYLTADLTFSGVRHSRAAEQRGSGDGLESVAALGLGFGKHFRHDRMVDSRPLGHDVLP